MTGISRQAGFSPASCANATLHAAPASTTTYAPFIGATLSHNGCADIGVRDKKVGQPGKLRPIVNRPAVTFCAARKRR